MSTPTEARLSLELVRDVVPHRVVVGEGVCHTTSASSTVGLPRQRHLHPRQLGGNRASRIRRGRSVPAGLRTADGNAVAEPANTERRLRLDCRAAGSPRRSARGRPRCRRPIRAPQRHVDQRLLGRPRQGARSLRVVRAHLAEGVRRRWAPPDRSADQFGEEFIAAGAPNCGDVVRRSSDGPGADRLRQRRPAPSVPDRHPRRLDDLVHRHAEPEAGDRGHAVRLGSSNCRKWPFSRPGETTFEPVALNRRRCP